MYIEYRDKRAAYPDPIFSLDTIHVFHAALRSERLKQRDDDMLAHMSIISEAAGLAYSTIPMRHLHQLLIVDFQVAIASASIYMARSMPVMTTHALTRTFSRLAEDSHITPPIELIRTDTDTGRFATDVVVLSRIAWMMVIIAEAFCDGSKSAIPGRGTVYLADAHGNLMVWACDS